MYKKIRRWLSGTEVKEAEELVEAEEEEEEPEEEEEEEPEEEEEEEPEEDEEEEEEEREEDEEEEEEEQEEDEEIDEEEAVQEEEEELEEDIMESDVPPPNICKSDIVCILKREDKKFKCLGHALEWINAATCREGVSDDFSKLTYKSKKKHKVGEHRGEVSDYEIYCRKSRLGTRNGTCQLALRISRKWDENCFKIYQANVFLVDHTCSSMVNERIALGVTNVIEVHILKKESERISEFFEKKLNHSIVCLTDCIKDMMVHIGIEVYNNVLTNESKRYVNRLFVNARAAVRRMYAMPFHAYLLGKYDNNDVKVNIQNISGEDRAPPTITSIAWMRPMQKEMTKQFADVISIDTTAHKNCLRWPVLLITGRNRENKVVVLMQALIMHETKPCFMWVLEQFKLISGMHRDWFPVCMFSDDDPSIFGAVIEWSGGKTLTFSDDWHHNCNTVSRLEKSVSGNRGKGIQKKLISSYYACKYAQSMEDFDNKWKVSYLICYCTVIKMCKI
jgi:hypothetical protein